MLVEPFPEHPPASPYGRWSRRSDFRVGATLVQWANNGAIEGGIGADFKHFGPGTLSVDVLGAYEVDAVNWTTLFTSVGGVGPTLANGYPSPVAFLGFNSGLKATISNNTSGMVAAKYSFGSWGDPAPPIVSKAPLPPSGPHGIPLTLYAGYEYIQFANPSDPVTKAIVGNANILTAATCIATGDQPSSVCSNNTIQVIEQALAKIKPTA